MRITKEEFIRMKPGHGRVFLEVEAIGNCVIDGKELKFETAIFADRMKIMSAVKRGVVLAASDKSDIPSLNYCWDTPIEVSVGDTVIFTADAIHQILSIQKDDSYYMVFDDNGVDRHVLVVPYKELVVRIWESGEALALNDYVIVALMAQDFDAGGLDVGGTSLTAPVPNVYEVLIPPSGNVVYDHNPNGFKSGYSAIQTEVGQIIKTKKSYPIPLEPQSELFYIQSNVIIGEA